MNEDFLHFVWKHQLFDHQNLHTVQGEPLTILKAGFHNRQDAGPDFQQSRIKIGGTVWAGNIEVHIKSSDWYKHGHQHDPGYDNIILHVVNTYDRDVTRANGESIPTLSLKEQINPKLITQYDGLAKSLHWIPCAQQVSNVDSFIKRQCLERALVERLETKSNSVLEELALTNSDWEAAFFRVLARTIGQKVNADAFLFLAKSIPWKILKKHRQDIFTIEALLFGQAGFLTGSFEEAYPHQLQKEYRFFRKKYRLQSMEPHLWKFLRLRPPNFPTIRIAQLAQLIAKSDQLLTHLRDTYQQATPEHYLSAIASTYWDTHFTFERSSTYQKKRLGQKMKELIIINAIAPTLFAYGRRLQNQEMKDKAIDLLMNLPPENNAIIRKWRQLNFEVDSAFDSQALLEMKTNYCDKRQCLYCSIGNRIIQEPLIPYRRNTQ